MQHMISADGVDLCVEAFGSAEDPAVLLIGGSASSMDWWDDELCARIAAGGRYVVRYDSRDTGRSTAWSAGAPGYGEADLAADVLRVLDGVGIAAAHVVGMSMGGGLAQRVAVEHPHRVRTLTLISTSPGGPGQDDLPPMSERVAAAFADPAPEPDWTDRAAVVEYVVAEDRLFGGTLPTDEPRLRALVGRVFDRTRDMAASMTNHWILEPAPPVRDRLGTIGAPTLVLHGTADPLIPYGHGEALAKEIPGARLVPLPGVGHQMPPPAVWEVVVGSILEHTRA